MTFNPEIHYRRSIRLRGYDYRKGGAYFLTICTFQRECLFGSVECGDIRLNEQGELVKKAWLELPVHYLNVALDLFVVMPNHVHGVILLDVGKNSGGAGLDWAGWKPAPTGDSVKCHGLAEIVRGFKTFSARGINSLRNNHGCPVWQRNY
jgi:putative transposase